MLSTRQFYENRSRSFEHATLDFKADERSPTSMLRRGCTTVQLHYIGHIRQDTFRSTSTFFFSMPACSAPSSLAAHPVAMQYFNLSCTHPASHRHHDHSPTASLGLGAFIWSIFSSPVALKVAFQPKKTHLQHGVQGPLRRVNFYANSAPSSNRRRINELQSRQGQSVTACAERYLDDGTATCQSTSGSTQHL